MIKETKTRIFDTETATIVKKINYGTYGHPAGFETTLYQTPDGYFFLYTYGGPLSPYKKEKITSFSKPKAAEWLQLTENLHEILFIEK